MRRIALLVCLLAAPCSAQVIVVKPRPTEYDLMREAQQENLKWFQEKQEDGLIVAHEKKGTKPWIVFSPDFRDIDETQRDMFVSMAVNHYLREPGKKKYPVVTVYVGKDRKSAKRVGVYTGRFIRDKSLGTRKRSNARIATISPACRRGRLATADDRHNHTPQFHPDSRLLVALSSSGLL
jgi:hypothetical protein